MATYESKKGKTNKPIEETKSHNNADATESNLPSEELKE